MTRHQTRDYSTSPMTPSELGRADAPVGASQDRVAELESELAQMNDRWMRSEAEIANVRTRARRDVDEARLFAVQKFATEIVEAAENLERGLQGLPRPTADETQSLAGVRSGLAGVERGFIAVLARNGIKREDPTGSPFDPNLHQAMAEHLSEGAAPGTVLKALTPVWTLNGRLLKPASVVVVKAPT